MSVILGNECFIIVLLTVSCGVEGFLSFLYLRYFFSKGGGFIHTVITWVSTFLKERTKEKKESLHRAHDIVRRMSTITFRDLKGIGGNGHIITMQHSYISLLCRQWY